MTCEWLPSRLDLEASDLLPDTSGLSPGPVGPFEIEHVHVDPALTSNNTETNGLLPDLSRLVAQEGQNIGFNNDLISLRPEQTRGSIALTQEGHIMSPPPTMTRPHDTPKGMSDMY